MVQPPKDLKTFESLLEVVKALRGPDGCPWDKEQTHRTLTPYAIEEAHELAEAIEAGTRAEVISELGDLLLQVALHAEIARQSGEFTITDVITSINEKMVRRHPHVFSDGQAADSTEVLKNWAEIKKLEKPEDKSREHFDVPMTIPALTRSAKIGSKTKAERFDWSNALEVWPKVEEEVAELKAAIDSGDHLAEEQELGDLLFSVAQLARHLKIEPEQALRATNQRFEKRFFFMRSLAQQDGKDFAKISTDEMEEYWKKAKVALKPGERA
jgi:tetrapyrrole methylase family protein/MazG family protein